MKPQHLYRKGLREVFKRLGLNFDNMDRGEEVWRATKAIEIAIRL